MWILEQVCEASSWHTTMKVNATRPPSTASVEKDSTVDTTEDTPSGGVMTDEVVLHMDVEDPDMPDWREALELSECDKWLKGANVELTSLHEMGVYKLVPCSEVPTNCSVLHGKFICCLKHNEVGNPV